MASGDGLIDEDDGDKATVAGMLLESSLALECRMVGMMNDCDEVMNWFREASSHWLR